MQNNLLCCLESNLDPSKKNKPKNSQLKSTDGSCIQLDVSNLKAFLQATLCDMDLMST